MKRKSAQFLAVRSEGGLLPSDYLQDVVSLSKDIGFLSPNDYHLSEREKINEEISRTYVRLQGFWAAFKDSLSKRDSDDYATSLTREKWLLPLFDCLGFGRLLQAEAVVVSERQYKVSHMWSHVPIHLVGFGVDVDKKGTAGGARGVSPHGLVQGLLNDSTTHLWGIVCNGRVLRMLRDNVSLTRLAYLEFDLESIFDTDNFADFKLVWLLCHQSRFEGNSAQDCILEKWLTAAHLTGIRIRDKLRDGFEAAVVSLGEGFLRHTGNSRLRASLESGTITGQDFYNQLLRLVYRLIFLCVAEERKLLRPADSDAKAFERYMRFYSITSLRNLAGKRRGTAHSDLWEMLSVVFNKLCSGKACKELGLPTFGSFLWSDNAIPALETSSLSNSSLLEALRHLTFTVEGGVRRAVQFGRFQSEELGSIYESLLELHPSVDVGARNFRFVVESENERRTTGSYYTPSTFVTTLLDHAVDPLVRTSSGKRISEQDLLSLRIVDPACGSGHFLIVVANRLAKLLAILRTGDEEPAPTAYRQALRDIISNCIYGVDVNPMSVELCKIALWMESLDPDKPLSFLENKILCGDSLVGLFDIETECKKVPDSAFKAVDGDDKRVASTFRQRNKSETQGQLGIQFPRISQRVNDDSCWTTIRRTSDDTLENVAMKEITFKECRKKGSVWWKSKLLCDSATAAFFVPLSVDSESKGEIITNSTLSKVAIDPNSLNEEFVDRITGLAHKHKFFHWSLEFMDVMSSGGFNAVISNPPFKGGLKISGTLGGKYRNYLGSKYPPFGGKADLSAAFFRRGFELLSSGGILGMVATNSISQGATKEAGLEPILKSGGTIHFAQRFLEWPGDATVEVNLLAINKNRISSAVLDGEVVEQISSRLDDSPEIQPVSLAANSSKAFQGSILLGKGFLLAPDEAMELISINPKNKECLFPYLTGEDFNSSPTQEASRWVIQFDERSESESSQYNDLWRIVKEKVYPERSGKDLEKYPRMVLEWWKFWNNRQELHRTISELDKVLIRSRVGELHSVSFVPSNWIYSEQTIVFAYDDFCHFGLLQSNVHEIWVRRLTSTLRTDLRYAPSDCFETFPILDNISENNRLRSVSEKYYEHRKNTMAERQIGLTKVYGLFNKAICTDSDIAQLRSLHVDLDNAVLSSYGWSDLDFQHGFFESGRGQVRYTVSREAQRELFKRLLTANTELGFGHSRNLIQVTP